MVKAKMKTQNRLFASALILSCSCGLAVLCHFYASQVMGCFYRYNAKYVFNEPFFFPQESALDRNVGITLEGMTPECVCPPLRIMAGGRRLHASEMFGLVGLTFSDIDMNAGSILKVTHVEMRTNSSWTVLSDDQVRIRGNQ